MPYAVAVGDARLPAAARPAGVLGISALMPPPEFFLSAEISLAPALHSAGCRSCPGFQTVLGAVCRHRKPAVCLLEAAAACSKIQKKNQKKKTKATKPLCPSAGFCTRVVEDAW